MQGECALVRVVVDRQALLRCGRISLGFDNCPCDQPSGLSLMQCQLEIMTEKKRLPRSIWGPCAIPALAGCIAQSYECANHANARGDHRQSRIQIKARRNTGQANENYSYRINWSCIFEAHLSDDHDPEFIVGNNVLHVVFRTNCFRILKSTVVRNSTWSTVVLKHYVFIFVFVFWSQRLSRIQIDPLYFFCKFCI